jgi:large subunit ribosomal protein L5
MPQLQDKYRKEMIPTLMGKFQYKTVMEVPKVTKVVLNMGLGEAITTPKLIEAGVGQLAAISGQKPVIRKARKSVASFKLREGQSIGVSVTLRKHRAYEFLERLLTVALPRVRDFRGISTRAFDGRGNYTLGIREQTIFPEVNYDTVEKVKGMNVTINTTAKTDEEARALLELMGFPFRKN